MAEYVTVIRESQRMCNKNRCAECPITKFRHECVNCYAWMNNHPEEVERIVVKWSKENPFMTNGMKFREVFGDHVVWESNEEMEAWLNAEYKGVQDEK